MRRATAHGNTSFIQVKFLSTLSLRRATRRHRGNDRCPVNFYPRSPCGERHPKKVNLYNDSNFYPRSPCGERLHIMQNRWFMNTDFYPRSPCGERPRSPKISTRPCLFLSTLSLRRATKISAVNITREDFYPRSPCGERRLDITIIGRTWDISIHALLAESDGLWSTWIASIPKISIHALLAESDALPQNIHGVDFQFLSTLSLRRATVRRSTMADFDKIFLSTLSLRRATLADCTKIYAVGDFYPRSPCGERRCPAGRCTHPAGISIHALLAESDSAKMQRWEIPH